MNIDDQSGFQSDRSTRSGRSRRQQKTKPKVYTAEEHKIMMKQRRHEAYKKELELLTSDNCPKRHPFDFRPGELQEIKQLFKDIQNQGKTTEQIMKAKEKAGGRIKVGLPI